MNRALMTQSGHAPQVEKGFGLVVRIGKLQSYRLPVKYPQTHEDDAERALSNAAIGLCRLHT